MFSVWTLAFWGTLGFMTLSLGLWFFIRMQTRRLWLPTLRVLELERSQVRKFVTQKPPRFAFLLFVLSVFLFLLFASQPKSLLPQESSPVNMRVHVFFDFNPSVSAYITVPNYIQKIEEHWNALHPHTKISVSTSHSARVWTPLNFKDLQEKLYTLGFHRAGVDLGSAFKKQRESIGEVDGLIIFSDGNDASWKRLNWKFLADDMKVYWVDLKPKETLKDNVFFKDVHLFSAPYDATLEWDLEIERSGDVLAQRRGNLMLTHGAETLATVPWNFETGMSKTILRVSVNAKKITKLERKSEDPLLWTLEPLEPDALTMDNVFRSPLKGLRQDAVLVGEMFGEREMEDPFYQLSMALQTFGFVPQRRDRWIPELTKNPPPFAVLAIDEEKTLQETCPLDIANKRAQAVLQKSKDVKFPWIWLMPKVAGSGMKNLCSCFYKMIVSASEVPKLCEQAFHPQALGEILKASGAVALGGKITNPQGAFGWFKEDQDLGMKVSAYIIPLRPSRSLGIDHAMFPLLVKELLQWQGLLDESLFAKKFAEWPRIRDLSQWPEWEDGNFESYVRETNVPFESSYLKTLSVQELPPVWGSPLLAKHSNMKFQKEDYDPGWWIHFILGSLAFLMLFEFFWNRKKIADERKKHLA